LLAPFFYIVAKDDWALRKRLATIILRVQERLQPVYFLPLWSDASFSRRFETLPCVVWSKIGFSLNRKREKY